jgi:hypothetical protein
MGKKSRSNRFSGLGNRRHQETKVRVEWLTKEQLEECIPLPGYVWSNPWGGSKTGENPFETEIPVGSIPLTCNLCGIDIPEEDLGQMWLNGTGSSVTRGPVGHNPFPLIETGEERCCDSCEGQVLVSRLRMMTGGDQ